MFFLYLFAFFATFGLLFLFLKYFLATENAKELAVAWMIIFFVVALFFLGIGILSTCINYSNQLSDFENIKKINACEKIYSDKAKTLTAQFASYLTEQYPDFEKNIFKTIGPDKVDLYLVKYPELKSSETITTLVAEIKSMQNDYYNQKLLKQAVLKNIRFRTVNPWIFNLWIPKPTEDILKY